MYKYIIYIKSKDIRIHKMNNITGYLILSVGPSLLLRRTSFSATLLLGAYCKYTYAQSCFAPPASICSLEIIFHCPGSAVRLGDVPSRRQHCGYYQGRNGEQRTWARLGAGASAPPRQSLGAHYGILTKNDRKINHWSINKYYQ